MKQLQIKSIKEDQSILLFKKCYALEMVRGPFAYIYLGTNRSNVLDYVSLHSDKVPYKTLSSLFDFEAVKAKLINNCESFFDKKICIYGKVYGGNFKRMRSVYGDELKFIVYDVEIDDKFLSVPEADKVCQSLGLEFVLYNEISTELSELDLELDKPSEIAVRRGMGNNKKKAGLILRPLVEFQSLNNERVIFEHSFLIEDLKEDDIKVRQVKRGNKKEIINSPAEMIVEQINTDSKVIISDTEITKDDINSIINELVTVDRLKLVLEKINIKNQNEHTVTLGMLNLITKEGLGAKINSPVIRSLISKRIIQLYTRYLKQVVRS